MANATRVFYLVQAVIDASLGASLLGLGLWALATWGDLTLSLDIAPLVFAASALSVVASRDSHTRGRLSVVRVSLSVLQLVTAGLPWVSGFVGWNCLYGCISTGTIAWWIVADPALAGLLGSGVLVAGGILGLATGAPDDQGSIAPTRGPPWHR